MSKIGVVIVVSQPGVTRENFSRKRKKICEENLIRPLTRLVGEGMRVILVIPCKKSLDFLPDEQKKFHMAEQAYDDPRPEEGLPHHLMTATADRVAEVFDMRDVELLVNDVWEDTNRLLSDGVSFAKLQGLKRIVTISYGTPIPSPEDVRKCLKGLETVQVSFRSGQLAHC